MASRFNNNVKKCLTYQASFHLKGLDFDCLHSLIQKLLLLILGRLGSRLKQIPGWFTLIIAIIQVHFSIYVMSFSLRKKYINNKQGESHGKQFVYQAKGLWTPIEPLKHAKTSSSNALFNVLMSSQIFLARILPKG